jgi:hypothetical protein
MLRALSTHCDCSVQVSRVLERVPGMGLYMPKKQDKSDSKCMPGTIVNAWFAHSFDMRKLHENGHIRENSCLSIASFRKHNRPCDRG